MYVSYQWLAEFLDLSSLVAEELAERMSRTGIEVEGVANLAKGIQGPLVIGQVEELVAHPNSDHLQVAQVNVGQYGMRQIVCGAPNVMKDAKVIVALEGCELPNGLVIRESELRGQTSQGMLCSLQEIGFPEKVVPKEYVDGLYLLDQEAPLGGSVIDYLELDDPVLELSITPNRADALSMTGVAYEVGAILSQTPHFDTTLAKADEIATVSLLDQVSLSLASEDLSDHYQLRLIKNVQVGPSPIKIQTRLMKANIRPINNIVDISNYCLLLFGQPMHTFDFDQLPGKHIAVRKARPQERLITLDEMERTLTEDDIVITADDQIIALAGVMGGLATHVTPTTKNVLLETAVFNPQSVRATSRRLGLRSESSARFEKEINPATVSLAAEQAAILMAHIAEGQIEEGVLEVRVKSATDQVIQLPMAMVKDKLGIQPSEQELRTIFDRLGFACQFSEGEMTVTIPPRRWDIHISADILEEIARIYGYDRIPVTLPQVPSQPAHLDHRQKMKRAIRNTIEGQGLNETLSYILVSPELASLNGNPDRQVSLMLPMSEDRSQLRQSMLPSMLEIARYNQARSNKPLAFYEMGRIFLAQPDSNSQPDEQERLTFFLSGEKQAANWEEKALQFDFYDLKGMLETVFDQLRLSHLLRFEREEGLAFMHPGRTAAVYLQDERIGILGQLHPELCQSFDLSSESFFAELDLDKMVAQHRPAVLQMPLAKYPAVSRDIALLVEETHSHQSLVEKIWETAGPNLIKLELFDRYTGDKIPEGKQSLAYHLTFQNPDKTLTDDEVAKAMKAVHEAFVQMEHVEIR